VFDCRIPYHDWTQPQESRTQTFREHAIKAMTAVTIMFGAHVEYAANFFSNRPANMTWSNPKLTQQQLLIISFMNGGQNEVQKMYTNKLKQLWAADPIQSSEQIRIQANAYIDEQTTNLRKFLDHGKKVVLVFDEITALRGRCPYIFFYDNTDPNEYVDHFKGTAAPNRQCPDLYYAIRTRLVRVLTKNLMPTLAISTDLSMADDFGGNLSPIRQNAKCLTTPTTMDVSDMLQVLSLYLDINHQEAEQLSQLLSVLRGRPHFFFDCFIPELSIALCDHPNKSLISNATLAVESARKAAMKAFRAIIDRLLWNENTRKLVQSMMSCTFTSNGLQHNLSDANLLQLITRGTLCVAPESKVIDMKSEPLMLEALRIHTLSASFDADLVFQHELDRLHGNTDVSDCGKGGPVERAFAHFLTRLSNLNSENMLLQFQAGDELHLTGQCDSSHPFWTKYKFAVNTWGKFSDFGANSDFDLVSSFAFANCGVFPDAKLGPDLIVLLEPCDPKDNPAFCLVQVKNTTKTNPMDMLDSINPGFLSTTVNMRKFARSSLEKSNANLQNDTSRLKSNWEKWHKLLRDHSVLRILCQAIPFDNKLKTAVDEYNVENYESPILLVDFQQLRGVPKSMKERISELTPRHGGSISQQDISENCFEISNFKFE
jgi:hypothetical protein